MTLFLQFGAGEFAPTAPGPIFPEGTVWISQGDPGVKRPTIDGRVLDSSEIISQPRPHVPSVAPEDLEKAMDVGVLSPKSVTAADMEPVPFVARPLTWADKAKGGDPEKAHRKAHQDLLEEIEFLQMVAQQEGDEDEEMFADAADWLEEQQKILWAPTPGVPSLFQQSFAVSRAECLPMTATQEIKITRVEPMFSIGSIAGNQCVYLPWGFRNSIDGPPGIVQSPEKIKSLRVNEFVLADLQWHPQGKNFWKAIKIHPKLPTSEMLVSTVESVTNYQNHCMPLLRSGWQYNFEIPCDPENIGSIIGSRGKNINAIIQNIQKNIQQQIGYAGAPLDTPLPEVTITPIVQDPIEFTCSFRPTKARVRVYLPTGCSWQQKDVEELVSFMHS